MKENGIWTKRTIILYISLAVFQLIASIIYLGDIVWFVNWESSVLVAKGTPMYEQTGYVEMANGHKHHIPPDHFPMYFYLMAGIILIFGINQIIARIFTWLFVIATSVILLKIIKPKNELELIIILTLYFLDPMLFIINFYGKFDQIAAFFMILGLYLVIDERPFSGGLILGLGVMVKFFPIFALISAGIYLIRQNKILPAAKLGIGSLITGGSIFIYNYVKYGDQFTSVIEFQVNRVSASLSLWYYILPKSITGTELMKYQFVFYFIIAIILFTLPMEKNSNYLFAATSTLVASYLVVSRQYYATYAYFFSLLFVPVIVELYRREKYLLIIQAIGIYFIFSLGSLSCYNTCYPQINPFNTLSWIGVILVFIGTLLVIPYYIFLFYKKAFYD